MILRINLMMMMMLLLKMKETRQRQRRYLLANYLFISFNHTHINRSIRQSGIGIL